MNLIKIAEKYNIARSGVYFLESLPLALVSRFFIHRDLPQPTQDQVTLLWKNILQLHHRDAENLKLGIYPTSVLEVENPLRHMRSFFGVIKDGVRVIWRMRKGENHDFSSEAIKNSRDLPPYYTRNFHFQTDGYLSEASARRYDHQVDILFAGTAGAMRRLILPVLKKHTRSQGRFLELGCGAGSVTRAVLKTFPEAKVSALDLSAPYLKIAQEKLRAFNSIDFIQGDATHLDFKNDTFDAVYSVFVLHEMPRPEREALIREAYRVLKPGGALILADSLQENDNPDLNWALERFPKAYHEPFYTNYIKDDLKKRMEQICGSNEVYMDHAFFTKVVWLQKPPSSALS